MRCLVVLALVIVTACADDLVEVRRETSPSVVQNVAYTTNVFEAPPSTQVFVSSITSAAPVEASASNAVSSVTAMTVAPQGVAVLPPPKPDRDVSSSGVPACDRFLARAEMCSLRIIANARDPSDTAARITSSLESTRRAWRRALAQGGQAIRKNLEESCADMLQQYESSARAWCAH